MYTIPIEFTDYNGVLRKEEHSFHLNKAEIITWLMMDGDYTLDVKLKRIATERNGKEIMKTFRELIYLAYGKKSDDGRRFIKSEAVKNDFMETEAYSELFMQLVTDAGKAAEFVNKIIPKDVADDIAKMEKEHPELLEEYRNGNFGVVITPLAGA